MPDMQCQRWCRNTWHFGVVERLKCNAHEDIAQQITCYTCPPVPPQTRSPFCFSHHCLILHKIGQLLLREAMILSTGITMVDIIIAVIVLVAILLWISCLTHIPKGHYTGHLHSMFLNNCLFLVTFEGLRLPPGPPGKFIMGNAGDMCE